MSKDTSLTPCIIYATWHNTLLAVLVRALHNKVLNSIDFLLIFPLPFCRNTSSRCTDFHMLLINLEKLQFIEVCCSNEFRGTTDCTPASYSRGSGFKSQTTYLPATLNAECLSILPRLFKNYRGWYIRQRQDKSLAHLVQSDIHNWY